jgi:hypothetical protein
VEATCAVEATHVNDTVTRLEGCDEGADTGNDTYSYIILLVMHKVRKIS